MPYEIREAVLGEQRAIQREVDRVYRRCQAAGLTHDATVALVINAFLYATRKHHVEDHQEALIDGLLEWADNARVVSEDVWVGEGATKAARVFVLTLRKEGEGLGYVVS